MEAAAVLRRFKQLLMPRRVAVLEACIIGLVSALAAGTMAQGVAWLGGWRVSLARGGPAWLILPAIGCVGGLMAGWLVQHEAPEAAGSGMSQVRAVLFRVPMPLNLRVALVKLVSAVLALSSGFALGREGPTVQVTAALAAQLSHWLPTAPEQRRQLIAAGSGAGVAAAFNAPIAGVLFVAEQLLQDVSGATLGTAVLASLIGSTVSRLIGGNSLDVGLASQPLLGRFTVAEIPACIFLGLLAGLLGSLFNRGVLGSLVLYRRYLPMPLSGRMALAGLASGLIVAFMPEVFRDYAGLKDALLSGQIGWPLSTGIFASYFLLVLIGAGSGAPGGLLVPTLILGALLGNVVGVWQDTLWAIGQPSLFAHLGMAAFMAATAKAPITAIVIVFELTREFNLVLPLMIVAVTAYLVCERLFPGSFYDKILELNGIHLNTDPADDAPLASLKADQVMQAQVETLASDMPLEQVLQIFAQSRHRGFPVLEASKLVGIVTQTDLPASGQLPANTPLRQIMTPWPVTVRSGDALPDVLYLLNRFQLSRLPVVEGQKLVGIITRSDIIRAEARKLSGEREQLAERQYSSYRVYQTRSPATGKSRILLPLANPQLADAMLQLTAALASYQKAELECLQVIPVARHCDPMRTPVSTTLSRRLLRQAQALGEKKNLPVHTQIRVSTDIAQAILETIQERHINLLVMGWEGQSPTKDWIFGSIIDQIIREAPCDVMLVKLAELPLRFERWLVPLAGGKNAHRALNFLPALTTMSPSVQVRLCQVFPPQAQELDLANLDQCHNQLKPHYEDAISRVYLRDDGVAEAIVNLARYEQDDVIVLGASQTSLLAQVVKGNIPATIAKNSNCTVILVRGALAAPPD